MLELIKFELDFILCIIFFNSISWIKINFIKFNLILY